MYYLLRYIICIVFPSLSIKEGENCQITHKHNVIYGNMENIRQNMLFLISIYISRKPKCEITVVVVGIYCWMEILLWDLLDGKEYEVEANVGFCIR